MLAEYDIISVSDLRLRGGTTASLADEIRAQAAAGYRTALLHVDSPGGDGQRGLSPHLLPLIDDGLADLVLEGDEVRARHAIVRDPAVAQHLSRPRTVRADGASLVANHPVRAGSDHVRYDLASAVDRLTGWTGKPPVVYPIGPLVRAQLVGHTGVQLAEDDWPGVIDVTRWSVDRDGVRGVPVIGRHTRPDPEKWPASAQEMLAAYPDSDEVAVHILGGAEPARAVLGRVPGQWRVEAFGVRDAADFVADLDFFVFYHHPRWIEGFGRAVLEALASGAVAILPEYFRATFGEAAIYSPPDGVRDIVEQLSADRDAYRAQSKTGRDYAEARFGYRVHQERLATLVGPPGAVESHRADAPVPSPQARMGPAGGARVLFISSNGTGMGHLTRLLAMATRAGDRIEPFFFSLSSAVPIVANFGFPWEYCPSRDELDVPSSQWNPYFTNRFAEIVRRFHPRALVFDGTWPYHGLGEARHMFPDLLYVWSRRAMWHKGHRTDSLAKAPWFDLIIEPGEFAAEFDQGPTVGADAHRVDPITLVDRDDILSREQARAELGFRPDEVAVLATLGAGNFHDVRPHLDAIAEAVARRPDWQVYTTRAAISRAADHPQIRTISVFPLATYLRAFDIGVVAAGYNTFHEALLAALPSVFVPQPKITDDQYGRARYAEHVGAGLCVKEVTADSIGSALDRLADPVAADRIRARCLELYPGNGAAEAMEKVERLLMRRGVIT